MRRPLYVLSAALSVVLAACSDTGDANATPAMSIEEAEPALTERVADFEAMFETDSIGDLVEFMPPKLKKELFNGSAGEESARTALQQAWDESLQSLTLEEFHLDQDANDIQTVESGAYYKILPTYLTMSLNDDPDTMIDSSSETLAMTDQNTWYLVRLDQPQQVAIFYRAYPEFASVEVAPQSMTQRERSETE